MVRQQTITIEFHISVLSVLLSFCSAGVCYGQFETVINVPPDVPPIVVTSNTQLNLYEGAFVESSLLAGSQTELNENVEVNLLGGNIGGTLVTNHGAEVNIEEGQVGRIVTQRDTRVSIRGGEIVGDLHGERGSSITISGGRIGGSFLSYGDVTISGGNFQGRVEANHSSHFHISDGLFSEWFVASIGGETSISGGTFRKKVEAQGADITIAGGTFEEEFKVLSRDKLQIFGTAFQFDGQPISELTKLGDTATVGRVILRGDIPVLTGTFLDGNAFTIHLNRQESANQGWFHNGSTIDVTLAIPFTACDINDDNKCDVSDLDNFFQSMRAGDTVYDFDENGSVDVADINAWLVSAGLRNLGKAYSRGDANLDGRVDSTDLNMVGTNWQMPVDGWVSGDFNGDEVVNSADLNILGTNWNDSDAEQVAAKALVPEPSSLGMIAVIGLFAVGFERRRFHSP